MQQDEVLSMRNMDDDTRAVQITDSGQTTERLHRPFVLPARDEHFVQMRPQNVPKLILGDQWHPSLPAADCEGVGSAALASAGRQTRGFKNNQASMAI